MSDRRRLHRPSMPAVADADAVVADSGPTDTEIHQGWMRAMLAGDFEAAWRLGDVVIERRQRLGLSCADRPLHLRWVWDGRPLRGTVLVRCHHGLGDTIQFIRYVPILKERGADRIVVQAQPALIPLLARSMPEIDALIPLGATNAELPPFDVDIESTELPHALRTTLETIPAAIPYLAVDSACVAEHGRPHPVPPPQAGEGEETTAGHTEPSPACGGGLGGRNLQAPALLSQIRSQPALKVGIVWAAGAWHPARSLPLAALAPLADIPGVALHALQRGPERAQIFLPGAPPVENPDDDSDDVLDTASLTRRLDLVISVDTMVAHLAGALAAPVWTLLHDAADWRWMRDRADSPWYPTMRLFRQETPGDWVSVVREVAQRLSARQNSLSPCGRGSG
jgi:hypothetical protein